MVGGTWMGSTVRVGTVDPSGTRDRRRFLDDPGDTRCSVSGLRNQTVNSEDRELGDWRG